LKLEPGLSLVSIVGDGLSSGVGRFLAALGCPAKSLQCGPLRISATIPAEKQADAQRALHAAFC